MAKTRAFTSETGNVRVTAQQIGRVRNLHYNGQPTGEQFFSTHKPGYRRPVKHVMKGGSCFFAYKEAGDRDVAAGGESLNHALFKEALCTVKQTRLSLYVMTAGKPKHWCDVPVVITHAETERSVPRVAGDPYSLDVYIEFETEHWLGLKWQGRLHLEVFHTHAVDAAKQDELRSLELPVAEVELTEVFAYGFSEDDTDDDKEEVHRQRIKRILEGESGFLRATVLSNPTSKAYLSWLVSEQKRQINALGAARNQVVQELDESKAIVAKVSSARVHQGEQLKELHKSLEDERNRRSADSRRFGEIRTALERQVEELRAHRRLLSWATIGLLLLAAMSIALLYWL